MRKSFLALLFFLAAASASAPPSAQFRYDLADRSLVESRLKSFTPTNENRFQTIKQLFESAGCAGERLIAQPVPRLKQPNLICVLPGTGDAEILVGAHFDFVATGSGVADNWSGAALLPSLYESISNRHPRHTYKFIAFNGEEDGLVGSEFYAKKLSYADKARIQAMVNMDTLGLSPTEVWVGHSDKELVLAAKAVANELKLPMTGIQFEQVGSTDSESFARRSIPSITFSSVTRDTWPILHSTRDTIAVIRSNDYYDSYHLLAVYLNFLDEYLSQPKSERMFRKKRKQ